MNDPRDEELDGRLARTLRGAAPDRFADRFGDRVIARLERERLAGAPAMQDRAAEFATALERNFLRVVPLLAAASIVLGVYSWWGGRATADSVLDAALRLPQVSIATAYTPERIFGTDGGGD